MRLVLMTVILLSATATLTAMKFGANRDAGHEVAVLQSYVRESRVGPSGNVWLVRQTAQGDREKTALIFGYANDMRFCRKVADLYVRENPGARYECEAAN